MPKRSEYGWDFRTKEEKAATEAKKISYEEQQRNKALKECETWVSQVTSRTSFTPICQFTSPYAVKNRKSKIFKWEDLRRSSPFGYDFHYASSIGALAGSITGECIEIIKLNDLTTPDINQMIEWNKDYLKKYLADIKILESKKDKALHFLQNYLSTDKPFFYHSEKVAGKELVYIFVDDIFINEELVKKGYAILKLVEDKDEFYSNSVSKVSTEVKNERNRRLLVAKES